MIVIILNRFRMKNVITMAVLHHSKDTLKAIGPNRPNFVPAETSSAAEVAQLRQAIQPTGGEIS